MDVFLFGIPVYVRFLRGFRNNHHATMLSSWGWVKCIPQQLICLGTAINNLMYHCLDD